MIDVTGILATQEERDGLLYMCARRLRHIRTCMILILPILSLILWRVW